MGLFSEGGWRLFDWFVTVGLGGLMLAIVVPNFVKARTGPRVSCVPNLNQLRRVNCYRPAAFPSSAAKACSRLVRLPPFFGVGASTLRR
jgi:hypothetical protein